MDPPINEVPRDSNHVEIVYHKDGASAHAFRFAEWGEVPEAWSNGGWDKPGLVTLDLMRSDLTTKMSDATWGRADFPLAGNLAGNIDKARPSAVPAF
ncbi:NPP1 family protein [Streptomyces sp. NPDC050549]|uniref:NPP1 family protein n=1 Tax=Streptomyces sp. NPDC050549 TaxID=3155406 RepID=UPI003446B6F5